jgi:hypothetical protein
MDVDATLEFDEKVEGAVNNLLRLALQPLATVVRGAPLRQ